MVPFFDEKCNRNNVKHIAHVGLCSFTDVLLLALKVFPYIYLCITLRQTRLSSITTIYIERSYANRILQALIDKMDFLEKEQILNLFLLKHLNFRCDLYMF